MRTAAQTTSSAVNLMSSMPSATLVLVFVLFIVLIKGSDGVRTPHVRVLTVELSDTSA
jgi:hypothetical protein